MTDPEFDDHTPILVGVGTATQRCADPRDAAEPLELMRRSLVAAGDDSGAPELLARLGDIAVPHGRWDYADPGRWLAASVGAAEVHAVHTLRAEIGVLQQTLIARACERVGSGAVDVAAVVGGEAGHRIRQATKTGTTLVETPTPGTPDEIMIPDAELRLPVEKQAGLSRAVGYYAIIESAFRHRRGWSVDESRDRIAALYSRMSARSLHNPDAWRQEHLDATAIRDPSVQNPMMAFPYARRHASSWSVDQAGALVVCSAATARRLGIPSHRFVHPVASAESNHMTNLCQRADLSRSPGATDAARAVLDHLGAIGDDMDLADLYSCFPVAVELFAEALGLNGDRPTSVTGGMPWAGGPYNNYVLQATCRMADLIRSGAGRTGIVTCVSGLMTKQAAAVWSGTAPDRPFANLDVTAAVAERDELLEVVDDYSGPATVAGYTVLHDDSHRRGIAVLDLPDRRRTMARTDDQHTTAAMECEEWCGRDVYVDEGIIR